MVQDLSLPNNAEFDKLFEYVLLISQDRETRATSGRMLMTRGIQKLTGGNYYEAIRLLGRAQHNLAMRECRSELITTLALCASAYESVGLLWAARSNILLATSQAFNEYWENGTITTQAFTCLQKLIWIELQLGQIPIILAWIELATFVAQILGIDREPNNSFFKDRENQDQILGILILKTSFKDLHCLETLPIILDNLDLQHSFFASLYTLGYEDYLQNEGCIPQGEDELRVRDLCNKWIAQPASQNLPESPEFLNEANVKFYSQVLGCNIIAETINENSSIFIAESILAAFEAFLSTSLDAELFPHQTNIRFQIISSDSTIDVFDFHIQEENTKLLETVVEIKHSIDGSYTSSLNYESLNKKLAGLLIHVILHIAYIPNPEHYFDKLLQDEFAFSRAFNLTNISSSTWNILGATPKLHLIDWQLSDIDERFPPKRISSWNVETIQNVSDGTTQISSKLGQDDSLPRGKRTDQLKHQDRRVFSLIDLNLWDKAKWKGTGFGFIPNDHNLPLLSLALLFEDENASKKIFSQWRQEFGNTDTHEKIRVSIITGIDSDNPAAYRVVIGINHDCLKDSNNSQFILTHIPLVMEGEKQLRNRYR